MTSSAFTSKRISKTSAIILDAPISKVFPLFGPVKEKEWSIGWKPQMIYPATGNVEEHMVFKTAPHAGHNEPDYTWVVSKYQPAQALIEYTVFTPERVWWITIQCREEVSNRTTAEITYTYSGLTNLGNAIDEKALQAMYARDLKDWEMAIVHYLKTGKKLEHH